LWDHPREWRLARKGQHPTTPSCITKDGPAHHPMLNGARAPRVLVTSCRPHFVKVPVLVTLFSPAAPLRSCDRLLGPLPVDGGSWKGFHTPPFALLLLRCRGGLPGSGQPSTPLMVVTP